MLKSIFKRDKSKKITYEQEGEKVVSFMKKAIKFSFAFIVIYVIWTQVAITFGFELNDTVTEGVFAFFGAEVMIMCLKKMFSMFLQYKAAGEEVEEEEYSDDDCLCAANPNSKKKVKTVIIDDDF